MSAKGLGPAVKFAQLPFGTMRSLNHGEALAIVNRGGRAVVMAFRRAGRGGAYRGVFLTIYTWSPVCCHLPVIRSRAKSMSLMSHYSSQSSGGLISRSAIWRGDDIGLPLGRLSDFLFDGIRSRGARGPGKETLKGFIW